MAYELFGEVAIRDGLVFGRGPTSGLPSLTQGTGRSLCLDGDLELVGAIDLQGNAGDTTVFNDDGLDVDFRIEGDTDANLFTLDAGLDAVGIGGVPAASVKFGIDSTAGAFRLPRMTTAQRDALTAVNGMMIYNTTTVQVERHNGTAWATLGVTDHRDLNGLADDDHTQYILADGTRAFSGGITGTTINLSGQANLGADVLLDGTSPVLFINETADAHVDIGLVINMGTATSTPLLSYKHGSVTHALTTGGQFNDQETDTIFQLSPAQGAGAGRGGCNFQITAEDDAGIATVWAVDIAGGRANTAKTTSASGTTEFAASQHDGANTLSDIAADGNIFTLRARRGSAYTTVLIVDEDGDLLIDGTQSAFDGYEDAHLVRALDQVMSPDKVIRSKWDEFVQYSEDDLVKAGILGGTGGTGYDNRPLKEGERRLVCMTQLQRLHNGAIWQLYTKYQELASKLAIAEKKMGELKYVS